MHLRNVNVPEIGAEICPGFLRVPELQVQSVPASE